ncbi:hypothetical protein J437_LFUL009068 [Ladona fulva]|uniref:Uncharacterized protein n=1 Tax=Ladona fulva TaxID=123851 RepID=A0A8K0P352_LADFU|nr:hypothetical protein J437_LFUL009068 [Ladona fulva]
MKIILENSSFFSCEGEDSFDYEECYRKLSMRRADECLVQLMHNFKLGNVQFKLLITPFRSAYPQKRRRFSVVFTILGRIICLRRTNLAAGPVARELKYLGQFHLIKTPCCCHNWTKLVTTPPK